MRELWGQKCCQTLLWSIWPVHVSDRGHVCYFVWENDLAFRQKHTGSKFTFLVSMPWWLNVFCSTYTELWQPWEDFELELHQTSCWTVDEKPVSFRIKINFSNSIYKVLICTCYISQRGWHFLSLNTVLSFHQTTSNFSQLVLFLFSCVHIPIFQQPSGLSTWYLANSTHTKYSFWI